MNPATTKTNYELLKNNCAFVNSGALAREARQRSTMGNKIW